MSQNAALAHQTPLHLRFRVENQSGAAEFAALGNKQDIVDVLLVAGGICIMLALIISASKA